ncbi:MAG: hypothetical protein R2851_19660 [Caldilineaceae bacterium]
MDDQAGRARGDGLPGCGHGALHAGRVRLACGPRSLGALARLWEREAVFGRAALLVECGEETASLRGWTTWPGWSL